MPAKGVTAKERRDAVMEAWARGVVDASPPLTAGQLEELAVLLEPIADYRAAVSPGDGNGDAG
jgi:hypothetical protein